MMKTRLIIASLLISGFMFFSKPIRAETELRNPALLAVSIPVLAAFVAVIVTAVFYTPDEKFGVKEKISSIPAPIKKKQIALQKWRAQTAACELCDWNFRN